MNPTQTQLLRSLGSGVRPIDLGEALFADADDRFDAMLRGAMQGRARTDIGVTMGPSVSGLFGLEQQDSIARAVDLAAAAGSEHALILHDTHTLRVDVRNRVVSEAPELADGQLITGIDAFVVAQRSGVDEDTDEENRELPSLPAGAVLPARVVRNASLVRTLAQAGDAREQ